MIHVRFIFYGILNRSYDRYSFNRLGDVKQFLSWYYANTSLVIAEIYDAFKRISEYFEYFESFQFNCYLLEKGYLQFLKKFFQRILNF